jgi:hypothetical protein
MTERATVQEVIVKKVEYGPWSVHPQIVAEFPRAHAGTPIWQRRGTKHEGDVLYCKLWNFWVRAGVRATVHDAVYFPAYETGNADTDALLSAAGFPWSRAETEEEVWERIGLVWHWLGANVSVDAAEYATLFSAPGAWPSIADYAAYYASHGRLVWAACFSKAHLFATLLGRMIYPRFRFGIAEAHHTEGGAPPTATHVYAGVYVADRWYYLDPTAVPFVAWPPFAGRVSIGVFGSVDYQHPYAFLPVPLSGFDSVPHLPA